MTAFQGKWPGASFDFSDARVLVTGGTSGIGAAIAAAFNAAGAQVTITGTHDDAGTYPDAPRGTNYLPLQLQSREQIHAAARQFDRLDVLVNNAGGTGGGYSILESQIFVSRPVKRAVNARTGREFETPIVAAEKSRHVLVVGGGPAGMEVARVAALRGHRVTLCEQSSRLGGTVFFSSVSYPPNAALVDYLRGDDIRAMITAESDGKGPPLPALTGTMLKLGSVTSITARPDWMRRLSMIWMPMGRRIVMIGGGLVAIELAEFLAERGREVTLLEEGEVFGHGLMLVRRWRKIADCNGVNYIDGAMHDGFNLALGL